MEARQPAAASTRFISDDGRHVAFATFAPNLLGPGTSSAGQILVRDLIGSTTTLASQSWSGAPANGFSQLPNLSSDGRFVTFQTAATNLSAGDNNGWSDVYIRDTVAGTTERVTFAADGGNPNDQLSPINQPDVSDDGRFVAFQSRATNLVPGDANAADPLTGGWDVFVRDLQLDHTQRVSVAGDGAEGACCSGTLNATMGSDGRSFIFDSIAANLAGGDGNKQPDVFFHDRLSGATSIISLNGEGLQANSASSFSAASADARHVAFTSYANNLAPGGLDDRFDVFARDLGPTLGTGGVAVQSSAGGIDVSGWVNIEGGIFASATDPAGDPGDGGRTGSDLVGASIAYRPKSADLLFSWQTASLPSVAVPATPEVGTLVPGATASVTAPGVAFVTTFGTTGYGGATETWQVRASGTSANPSFGLFYCGGATCSRMDTPTGGIGVAGHEVRVRVPVTSSLFNTSAGDVLMGTRAYVTPLAAEVPSPLDSIDLGDAVIPKPEVTLGWGPAGAVLESIEFAYAARIVGSRFEASIDDPPGAGDRLWIRACRGPECSTRSYAVPDGVVAGTN